MSPLEDPNLTKNIVELVELSKQKKNLEQSVTPDYPPLKNIKDNIDITRGVVLENLSNLKNATQINLDNIQKRLGTYNSRLNKLPKKEKELLSLQRDYDMTADEL